MDKLSIFSFKKCANRYVQVMCKLLLIYTLLHAFILLKTCDFSPFLRIYLPELIPR